MGEQVETPLQKKRNEYKSTIKRLAAAIHTTLRESGPASVMHARLSEVSPPAPLCSGVLTVTVLAAHNLQTTKCSVARLPSAYVTLRLGKQDARSSVVRCRHNPVWDRRRHTQTFTFQVKEDEAMRYLKFSVEDATSVPPGYVMGTIELDVHELKESRWLTVSQVLESKTGVDQFLDFKVHNKVASVVDPDTGDVWTQMLDDLKKAFSELLQQALNKPGSEATGMLNDKDAYEEIVAMLDRIRELREDINTQARALEDLVQEAIACSGMESPMSSRNGVGSKACSQVTFGRAVGIKGLLEHKLHMRREAWYQAVGGTDDPASMYRPHLHRGPQLSLTMRDLLRGLAAGQECLPKHHLQGLEGERLTVMGPRLPKVAALDSAPGENRPPPEEVEDRVVSIAISRGRRLS